VPPATKWSPARSAAACEPARPSGTLPVSAATPKDSLAVDANAGNSATARGTKFPVLGIKIDAVQIPDVIQEMRQWIAQRGSCRYIAVTGMHGVMEAQHDPLFRSSVASADLVVPDGMPLVWIGRLRGHALERRVYGPELQLRFCQETAASGCRHYFYGGAPGVPEQLVAALVNSCPGIEIAGTFSPPFEAVTAQQDAAIVQAINRANPDVLWVGLGTPKQETWMREHRELLRVPVIVGVGAAFDFLSRRKKQAPRWMQEHGLEWLFRLLQEPRRLWRRYLVNGPQFIFLVLLELLGLRRFD
jgi:N-acetylglucosaminyldiphosphoundecaprenol N-acetyl-beta-D-mannosaminyltransferase